MKKSSEWLCATLTLIVMGIATWTLSETIDNGKQLASVATTLTIHIKHNEETHADHERRIQHLEAGAQRHVSIGYDNGTH